MAKPVPRTARPPAVHSLMGGVLPNGARVLRFEDGTGVVQDPRGRTLLTWGKGETMHPPLPPPEFPGPALTPFGGVPLRPLPALLARPPLPVAPDSGYHGATVTGTPNRYLPAAPVIYGTRIA